MANLNEFLPDDFDPDTYIPQPVPEGEYILTIIKSETVPTKAGDGTLLKLSLKILDDSRNGDAGGKVVFDQLCIAHPNPVAVRMAQEKLATICKAVGVARPGDTNELHNIPMVAKVVIAENKASGQMQNEVKRYKKFERSGAVQADKNDRPYGQKNNVI